MEHSIRSLSQLQQWMQMALQAGLDGQSPDEVDSFVAASSKQTSSERLQVYCNAYYARLLDVLRDEYASLVGCLGEDVFDSLALAYLNQFPSTSHTLSQLGSNFPRFIEDSEAEFADLDPVGESPGSQFGRLLVDLARLERAQYEVFDGPGMEDLPPITLTQLQQLAPGDWGHLKLRLAPCLRLLACDFPVHRYIVAVRHDVDAQLPNPEPTWLAITRKNYVVRRIPLTADEFQVLQNLIMGKTLGAALAVLGESDLTGHSLEVEIQRWFRAWMHEGFFQAFEVAAPRA